MLRNTVTLKPGNHRVSQYKVVNKYKGDNMTRQQVISRTLILKTVPIKFDMAYYIYLIEYARLNKN